MAFAEEEIPRIETAVHTVGQDLASLSVEELRKRIDLLREEIARLEDEMASKAATRSAADALFSR